MILAQIAILAVLLVSSATSISPFHTSSSSDSAFLTTPFTTSLIQNFSLPTPNAGPNAIIPGGNGTFWVAEFSAGKIAELFPSNRTFHEFNIPESGAVPVSLALDQFGMIWFSDQKLGSPGIWSLNATTGVFKKYPIPTAKALPLFVLVDSQHDVWFTETTGYKIGELSYPSYSMTEYPVPLPGYEPLEMALDQNHGMLWITIALTTSEVQPGALASFNMTSKAFEKTYYAPFSLQDPVGIVLDKSGNLWVSEHRASSIVEFNPITLAWRKYVTSAPAPVYQEPISAPATVAIDANGNLWFIEHFGNKVGRLDPKTGAIDEFDLTGMNDAYSVLNSVDPQGNFWFTNLAQNAVQMIPSNATTSIQIREVPGNESENAIPQVGAGNKVSMLFEITNTAASSQTLSLNATSSFSAEEGATTPSEVSFNTTSFELASNQSRIIQVTITPDVSLASGQYTISLSVSGGDYSTVRSFLIQVNASPLYVFYHFGDYLQYVLTAAILILAGLYLVFRRKRRIGKTNKSTKSRSKKTAAEGQTINLGQRMV